MDSYSEKSLIIHEQLRGKVGIHCKMKIESRDDLSVAYTPGVAAPCMAIYEDPEKAHTLTIKHNTVAVVSDGSAVLGLGNIGPRAAIPVMEGKALLFKQYADIDAFPICLDTQDTEKIIETIRNIAPVFGGINLEDISAPRCFEIEDRLQDLDIPVFHDDQHGTAIVTTSAIINACRVLGRKMSDLTVVINGAGAAGVAIAKMLQGKGLDEKFSRGQGDYAPVKEIILCDSKGAIHSGRTDLNEIKQGLLSWTNQSGKSGHIKEVIKDTDVFVGVSKGNILDGMDIRNMNSQPIILAMSNPTPEIMPDVALDAGAGVVGTGRSDFPNQVNNVLAFPGIFRGALDARAPSITPNMKITAALALADFVEEPTVDSILPDPREQAVAPWVGKAVRKVAEEEFARPGDS